MLKKIRDRIALGFLERVEIGRDVGVVGRTSAGKAPGQRCIKQPASDFTLLQNPPDRRSSNGMRRFDPDFPAQPPLGHALRSFESMDIVRFDTSVADADALFHWTA